MSGAGSFMFTLDEELSEDDLVAMIVTTPSGETLHIWAAVELVGREATLRQFAIYGLTLGNGGFGWVTLRCMADAAMEEFNVDCIRIEEARRTTGPRKGRQVKPLEFRRRTQKAHS